MVPRTARIVPGSGASAIGPMVSPGEYGRTPSELRSSSQRYGLRLCHAAVACGLNLSVAASPGLSSVPSLASARLRHAAVRRASPLALSLPIRAAACHRRPSYIAWRFKAAAPRIRGSVSCLRSGRGDRFLDPDHVRDR